MANAITVRALSKSYGKKRALNELNLTIPSGMFALLGPNGAGKSTLMRILATLASADAGEAEVLGIPVSRAREVRETIGYLPQDFSFYGGMRVREALWYMGLLSGMARDQIRMRSEALLERVHLTQEVNRRVKALSGGMLKRLGIAQALLHDPEVLIVDEPTAGLDPEERVRFRNLLCQVAEKKTILLSTHIVGDVEATCENIAVLEGGKLLFGGNVEQLLRMAEGKVYQVELPAASLAEFRECFRVISAVPRGRDFRVRFLNGEGAGVGKLVEPGVEDAYMILTGKGSGL